MKLKLMLSVKHLVTYKYKKVCLYLYSLLIGIEVLHDFEETFQVDLIL